MMSRKLGNPPEPSSSSFDLALYEQRVDNWIEQAIEAQLRQVRARPLVKMTEENTRRISWDDVIRRPVKS